jgi:hypothetical protein
MNINRIITESINKIIAENTQALFQQLNTSYANLESIRYQIKKTNLKATNNQQIVNFVGHRLYNFIAALEQALKRCIYARNINEGAVGDWAKNQIYNIPQGLGNFGFKIPQEFNNAWNTGYNYYNKAHRFLFPNQNRYQSTNTNGGYQKLTGNEKLIYLLDTIWPKIQKEYLALDGQVNFNRTCQIAVKAKNEIEAVYQTVKLIRNSAPANTNSQNVNNNQNINNNQNAQGTNP